MNADERIQDFLQLRKDANLFRQLSVNQNDSIDFSSNDYLGFSRSAFIRQQVELDSKRYQYHKSGATGSRLLNGNSSLYQEVEQLVAQTHHAKAALLFNSGFDANVGLISTVIRPEDVVFYDELVHASIHQGMKLSCAKMVRFKHNDLTDLENKLKDKQGQISFIITESLFSMEGDKANLKEIACLAAKYDTELIIDEAHATGLFGSNGSGLCNEAGIEDMCFARIYTFGKAIGSHGAAVVGSNKLKDYLINFSKNFIYSTALETHNLLSVKHTYNYLYNNVNQKIKLINLILYFNIKIKSLPANFNIIGEGPVFGILVPGNKKCKNLADFLQSHNLDVRAILSPTVPNGTERLRIVLHSFNSTFEIDQLCALLTDYK